MNPSGEYVDVPWTETENFGFAFQACNVNSNLGSIPANWNITCPLSGRQEWQFAIGRSLADVGVSRTGSKQSDRLRDGPAFSRNLILRQT